MGLLCTRRPVRLLAVSVVGLMAVVWLSGRHNEQGASAGDGSQLEASEPTRIGSRAASPEPVKVRSHTIDTADETSSESPRSETSSVTGPNLQSHPSEYTSLDHAPAHVVAERLAQAIDRAREERGIPISGNLIDRVIDEGEVHIIVAQQHNQPSLEPMLAGSRHEPARYFHHIPFAAIEVGPQALLEIIESSDIVGIEEDRRNRPSLMDTVPLIAADTARAAGYDGTGLVIAMLDTGVDTSHPVFAGRVIDEACFSRNGDCPAGGTEEFGPGAGAPCNFGCGHGTLVAGVALGLDPAGIRTGVAPDAGLISIQVYSNDEGRPTAWTSDIVAGLEHVYDLRLFHAIAAVNLSLGGDPYNSTVACDTANSARKAAIDLLRGISVPSIVSSGNDGFTDLIAEPGCISTAISVGSTSKADEISSFSNSASFLSLLAPGQSVETSRMGGGFARTQGTSISAPHVTGAWVSILEAVPGSNVAEVLHALQSTGLPILDARNGITTPRIDVAAAIAALDAGIDIPDPVGGGGAVGPLAFAPSAGSGSACGLVGLESLAVCAAVRVLRRRPATTP